MCAPRSQTSLLVAWGMMMRKMAASWRKNSRLTPTRCAVAAVVGALLLEELDEGAGGGLRKRGRCLANVLAFVGRMTTFDTRPCVGTRSSRAPPGSL